MIESMGSIQKQACARHIEELAADRSSRRSPVAVGKLGIRPDLMHSARLIITPR
jgi:hypothetical protein